VAQQKDKNVAKRTVTGNVRKLHKLYNLSTGGLNWDYADVSWLKDVNHIKKVITNNEKWAMASKPGVYASVAALLRYTLTPP
jgi:hypothetical protein